MRIMVEFILMIITAVGVVEVIVLLIWLNAGASGNVKLWTSIFSKCNQPLIFSLRGVTEGSTESKMESRTFLEVDSHNTEYF